MLPDESSLRARLQTSLGTAYTLERELGGGGMSRVFVAEEARLRRRVVVKVLAPELAAGVSAERFEREIALAAALQEPHIVPVLTAGVTVDGLPYYTMPYVEGETLRARMERGALALAESVAILRNVAQALAYAHAHKIVHRDVKPENVLLSSGTAVVTDFGIAKALSASRTIAPDGDASAATLTQHGTSIGTPAYMAPEQAAGDPATDHRADLYAWGVMAYELLAGHHPFAGTTTPQALMAAHFSEPPPPLPHAIPRALAAVVMRSLAKVPAERPASAGDLLVALDTIAVRTAPGWGSRHALVATVVLIAAGLGLTTFLLTRGRVPSQAPALTSAATEGMTNVAVLPFVNTGGDPKDEYFSDGMRDEVAHALVTLPGLRVAGRTSSYAFKGKNVPAAEIGRALDVAGLVEGTVRRAGDRLRVSVQLISTADGKVRWSDSYERAAGDVFVIQDELTKAIIAALTPALTPALHGDRAAASVGRGTRSLAAYDLYLRGRYFWARRGADNLLRAAGYFQEAIAADPRFARAHAGLAMTYGVLPFFSPDTAGTMPARALAQAARALAMDSTLADANLAMANALSLNGRNADAEPWFARAIAFDPRSATAHQWHGGNLLVLGRGAESVAELRVAVTLDPLSPAAATDLAQSLIGARNFDEAIIAGRRAAELGIARGLQNSGLAYLFGGHPDSAVALMARGLRDAGNAPVDRVNLALAYAAQGRWDEVDRIREALARVPGGDPSGMNAAILALAEGDHAPLLRALETPAGAHEWFIRYYSLGCSPLLDPLATEPGFQALLARRAVARCAGASPWPIKPRRRP